MEKDIFGNTRGQIEWLYLDDSKPTTFPDAPVEVLVAWADENGEGQRVTEAWYYPLTKDWGTDGPIIDRSIYHPYAWKSWPMPPPRQQ